MKPLLALGRLHDQFTFGKGGAGYPVEARLLSAWGVAPTLCPRQGELVQSQLGAPLPLSSPSTGCMVAIACSPSGLPLHSVCLFSANLGAK